ncbi:MAG: Dipeptide transport system permease protein DppB [Dehalococcoidia bacterium]|nr:Dipeptide transport system permease protein DppB [Chloroflexota bacterium]MBT9162127.1 Dipeptide transport system permease protein DppB [Chloroflexota bacterium]MBT9163390.1 Dipeptide transport system permease protein DppB [Chloroflexota bacterium]
MARIAEGHSGEKSGSTLGRVGRYMLVRALTLGISVVIAVYITILIANMGGHVDQIKIGMIDEGIAAWVAADEELLALPRAEREEVIAKTREIRIAALGLDIPFPIRSVRYLTDAMSLDLGHSTTLMSDKGSRFVREILLERLPHTLLLFGTTSLLMFFVALFGALFLSRRYGSKLDQAVIALAPTSAAPAWFYGIFLILIFAAVLRLLPFGGFVAAPPPPTMWEYALSVLRHMVLPVSAMVIGGIFVSIYNWRTFFLIHSSEDYVEMAKAKGLSSGAIERQHILRPTLPPIITSFALMLIGMWMGAIVLETIFGWPGLGSLLWRAMRLFETAVVVGAVVIYAYLLVVTLFLLDIVYAVVDPRVKVGAEGRTS